MNVPHPKLTSQLKNLQPIKFDREELKRLGWQQQQILVISPEDSRLYNTEREFLKRLGERLYGKEECHG